MKTLRRVLFAILLLFAALGLHAWWVWSPRAPVHALSVERLATPLPLRLRSPEEHDRIRAAQGEPYVLELTQGQGELLYYGAYHSEDPDDPQLDDVRGRWAAFAPTVALCEGRKRGHLLGPLLPRLVGLSESALVHQLARRDGVRLLSLEPEYEEEVAGLLRSFAPQDVALFFTLRVYWSESGGVADEGLAEHLREKRTDAKGLRGHLENPGAMDAAWARIEPEGDWRSWTAGMTGTLRSIDLASRRVRGEHMARVLIDLVAQGERVMAVVGSGHVIRQEWALRAALGADPAPDQPQPQPQSQPHSPEQGD